MNRLTRIALGAALGALAASAPARDWGGMYVPLEEADLALISSAADQLDAAPGGGASAPVSWENPKNGTRGTVEIAREFEHEGAACRQYRLRIVVSGYEPFTSDPVMCQVGGEWRLMSKSS